VGSYTIDVKDDWDNWADSWDKLIEVDDTKVVKKVGRGYLDAVI
jgi:hypothetical protein